MPSSDSGRPAGRMSWHLLVHALPPRPLYLRAKVRNRLARSGAIALKNAVYVLPRRPACLEEFRSIADDAIARGGKAYVCDAEFFDPATDAALVEEFRAGRAADYRALEKIVEEWGRGRVAPEPAEVARARKRFEEIVRIDFFESSGRRRVEAALRRAENRTRPSEGSERASGGGVRRARAALTGRVWATRPGVQIDRIASAWLVRRFIDPAARFRFVDPKEKRGAHEIRFDMSGGDYTHEDDRCTFETLVRLAGPADSALRNVAEIVHDIDLKDGKFSRADAAGVQQIILGIVLGSSDDEERLRRGFSVFEDLYASFRRAAGLAGGPAPKGARSGGRRR